MNHENHICLGCGDEQMEWLYKSILCEVCWSGD